MSDLKFDHYYRYDELTSILDAFAVAHPELVRKESIGKSFEGRDVWVMTVTNFSTGADTDKPAFWIDGNIHASEVSPASACVYFLNYLLENYGADEQVTRTLDTRAYYICPRVNPDGAELALAEKPRIIRSSVRPYPYDEEPIEGLIREDLDGDGRLLNMRIIDPNGPWKADEQDPRILLQREPTDVGGTYYRLLPEGRLENYDGVTLGVAPFKEGLDLNRNFPMGWRQESDQRGAGPFPTSEPEVRNLTHFISTHPNITGGIAFHTWSGVLLRPYDDRADDEMPAEDLWTFQKIGEKGTQITGYPNISVFHDFKYHPKQVITGSFDTWMYEHRGVYAWTVEIWSPQRQAGIEKYKFIDWDRVHPIEEDRMMMKWNDEVLEGKGYVDWHKFNHPQLGEIEIGGWDEGYAFRNPPPPLLEKELALFPQWLLWHTLISPQLKVLEVTAKPLNADTYTIRFVVENTGWLPTYITKKAVEKKIVRGVQVELELPAGATLETGKIRTDLGQLEGRAYKDSAALVWVADSTDERAKVEWTVRAPLGGTLTITAKHERAGTVKSEVKLGSEKK